MAAYVVTGPLAVVRDSAGKLHYFYAGAVLPEHLPAEELKRLEGRGLLAKVAEPVAAKPQADPPSDPAGDGSAPDRPSAAGAKAAWVEYAVAQGMDRDEADKLTRDQLVDAYPAE